MNNYLDNIIETQFIDEHLFDESFMKTILDHAPMVIVVLNKRYEMIYANKMVQKLIGYTEKDLIGKICYQIINKGVPCDSCATRQVIETGKPSHLFKEEIASNGVTRYNERMVVPIMKSDNTFEFVVEILIDRTEEYVLTKRIENDFFKLIKTISMALEAKDKYTGNHSQNVKVYAMALGADLGLSSTEMDELLVAATLHDIGKIGIPDSIINKNGRLTNEEFDLMKNHPVLGSELLSELESFGNIKQVVKYHHERPDGKGYPDGLIKGQIPLLSRIISIADSFDAMTSTRSYRHANTIDFAKQELLLYQGTQFDNDLVTRFVKLIDEKKIAILQA